VFSDNKDDVTRRLAELRHSNIIDGQLAKIKEEIRNKNQEA